MAGEIYIADKATLDNVNADIGSNTDVAGTNTLFALAKKIDANFPVSGGTDFSKMTTTPISYYYSGSGLSVTTGNYASFYTVNGRGLLTDLHWLLTGSGTDPSAFGPMLIIDGVQKIYYTYDSTNNTARFVGSPGAGISWNSATSSSLYSVFELKGPIPFNTSLIIAAKNASSITRAYATVALHGNILLN
jgi:hypothetical protein